MNAQRYWPMGLLVMAGLCVALVAGSNVAGQGKKKVPPKGPPLRAMLLEIAALETVDLLELTPAQIKAVQEMAARTGDQTRRKRPLPDVSDAYRSALEALHKAALKGDMSEEAADKFRSISDKDGVEVDASYEISEAAREKCKELFRLLTPPQLAACIGALEIGDPVQMLADAVTDGRGASDEDWKAQRDEATAEVAKLLRGVNQSSAADVAAELSGVLDMLRGQEVSAAEVQSRLEDVVPKMEKKIGPLLVIQNCVEHALAEFLSNPRLVAALEARRDAK
jgi:hypothetical protein